MAASGGGPAGSQSDAPATDAGPRRRRGRGNRAAGMIRPDPGASNLKRLL